jgi:hypothetical protein
MPYLPGFLQNRARKSGASNSSVLARKFARAQHVKQKPEPIGR